MATISRIVLSGSTNGRQIGVVASSSPGTTIHTGSTATNFLDMLYLYAHNFATSVRQITVEFAGTSSEDKIVYRVPAQDGLYKLVEGYVMQGATTALVTRAFGTATAGLSLGGYVNRAT